MRLTSTIITLLMLTFPSSIIADGYPFRLDTHEVVGDRLQLALIEAQVIEVSSTGFLTFTKEQFAKLSKFYEDVPEKVRVIASTFNDGLDVRVPNPVDCIWTSPTSVGITLYDKYEEGEYTFDTEQDPFPLQIRISPDGDLYHLGTKITRGAAIHLIRNAKTSEGDEMPEVAITLPPPYREPDRAESNTLVNKLFSELVEIGKEHHVVVRNYW